MAAMQPVTAPIATDLVLIGGGHSHAIALKLWGMNPLPGVRLTLISDTSYTPYSGMLPGYVAGFYRFEETHIDLRRLARFAQAQFYLDRAVGLDLEKNQVICASRPPASFDYLSLDIGSTPQIASVPGAREWAIAVKPVPQFLKAWNQLQEAVRQNPRGSLALSIVGGGAGGVELALNVQSRLQQILRQAGQPADRLRVHLFHRGRTLLPGHNAWVSRRLQAILEERGIQLHLGEEVQEILPREGGGCEAVCQSGLRVECAWIFWVTQAAAPEWIRASGLATESRGFVLVDNALQSISHPQVFAAGDIATLIHSPPPKAGVFAVRQGKPLFENLRRAILGKPLKPYYPQKTYLSLIGTGEGSAIASWSGLGWESPLLWRWKDHIDRQFMSRFRDLSPMAAGGELSPDSKIQTAKTMRCSGCGAKVGRSVLESALGRLDVPSSPDLSIGLEAPDDAAVVRIPPGKLAVHTVDFFPNFASDPFIFGKIAANHCLSDLFAMGATPQTALAIATLPQAAGGKAEETLYQLLSGAIAVLNEAKTPLVGGHTTEGLELTFGLACNGLVSPEKLLRKGGMKPGQVLILTKGIGTGTLLAAEMRGQAQGRWIDGAIESMLLSNQAAAHLLSENGASACTDVTGFGLLGHLLEMVRASEVAVEIDLNAIPILEGAIETIRRGITSSLHPQNLRASHEICPGPEVLELPQYRLLFDPQTAGGLLAALPEGEAERCLQSLQACGYPDSRIVGRVVAKQGDGKSIAMTIINL